MVLSVLERDFGEPITRLRVRLVVLGFARARSRRAITKVRKVYSMERNVSLNVR